MMFDPRSLTPLQVYILRALTCSGGEGRRPWLFLTTGKISRFLRIEPGVATLSGESAFRAVLGLERLGFIRTSARARDGTRYYLSPLGMRAVDALTAARRDRNERALQGS